MTAEGRAKLVDRRQTATAITAAATFHANTGVLEALHRALRLGSAPPGLAPRAGAVLKDVLAAVAAGALVGLREVVSPPVQVFRGEPEPWEPAPAPAPVKVTASLELKFVFDQADQG